MDLFADFSKKLNVSNFKAKWLFIKYYEASGLENKHIKAAD
jgi:hypothetical protein